MKIDRKSKDVIDVDGVAAGAADESVHVFVRPGALAAACAPTPTSPDFSRGRVLRYNGVGWDGLRAVHELDANGESTGATHRRLSPDDAGVEVRYIELDTGGQAHLDALGAGRTLVCHRGHGRLHLAGETLEIGFGDVVHIREGESASASNPYTEPFGLLCSNPRDDDEHSEAEHADT